MVPGTSFHDYLDYLAGEAGFSEGEATVSATITELFPQSMEIKIRLCSCPKANIRSQLQEVDVRSVLHIALDIEYGLFIIMPERKPVPHAEICTGVKRSGDRSTCFVIQCLHLVRIQEVVSRLYGRNGTVQ